jgi:hypothetical protein
MTTRPALALVLALAISPPALARAAATPSETITEVRVERVRPHPARLATLRFLKANRDFIRSRYDAVREQPVAGRGGAVAVDPRFLAYQELLAAVTSARDTVARDDAAARQREYLARVGELADLEAQLDRMERLLAEQRGRLAVVQADFTGHPLTELVVVASGDPGAAAPATVALALETGDTLVTTLTDTQRATLARGGAIELYRGFIEPRAQVLDLALAGGAWTEARHGYLSLDPPRDRITVVRLDLAHATPAAGIDGVRAAVWLHDGRLARVGG